MAADPVDLVLARLPDAHGSGSGFAACCPAHDDRSPSLAVGVGDDGRALVFCQKGCPTEAVVEKLGLKMHNLFPDERPGPPRPLRAPVPRPEQNTSPAKGGRIIQEAVYPYPDEAGTVLFEVVRFRTADGGKTFRQRRPNGKGGFDWTVGDVRRVPYRLPELLAADPSELVFVVEGEKDADRLADLGFLATCNSGGAGKWDPAFAPYFSNRLVVVVPDNDGPGRTHAEAVCRSLAGVAAGLRLLDLPGLPPKGDASDWLEAGGTADGLRVLAAAAPPFDSSEPAPDGVAPFPTWALPSAMRRYVEEAAAAVGVPAEMVGLPLLVTTAALIGNRARLVLKRNWAERAILWGVVVGDPGSGKSPAIDAAKLPLVDLQRAACIDHDKATAAFEGDHRAWKALSKDQRERIAEPRPPDLRHYLTTDATKEAIGVMLRGTPGLLVIRDELAAWIAGMDAYKSGRGGDRDDFLTLWSGGDLKVDRKGSGSLAVARPAVSVLGGIQPDRLAMLRNDLGQDGFVDRFLFVFPDTDPGFWREDEVSEGADRALRDLFAAVDALPADRPTEVRLSPEAKAAWVVWYDENAAAAKRAGGYAKGICAKLPSQLARIALVLHVATHPEDPPPLLQRGTMEDAIALVECFRDHTRRVLARFGDEPASAGAGLGARLRRILEERGDWMSATELHRALGGDVKAVERDRVLAELLDEGAVETRTESSGGRPATYWRAARGEGGAGKSGRESRKRATGDVETPREGVSASFCAADSPRDVEVQERGGAEDHMG